MEEGLLNECYICLEQCKNTSPCACETRVHPECLMKFLRVSNNDICTICKRDYDLDSPMFAKTSNQANTCKCMKKCVLGIACSIGLCILYILFGLVGQGIGKWLGITTDDPIETMWTSEHAFAAFCLAGMFAFVYLIFRRTSRNTV